MASVADVIADPAQLLHRIDAETGRLVFLPVTRAALEGASFLDGRTDFAAGPAVELEGADPSMLDPPVTPDRYIFHVSFCGSTLLTRMLARPGKVFALREPHALVDLADARKAAGPSSRLAALTGLVRASHRARWQPDEVVLVKPSNWVNNLLPELCNSPASIRPLFVDIGARAFLRAVFRGNRERIEFTLRAAQHFAGPADAALLAAAVQASPDPLGRAANLTLVALHLQRRAFADAMAFGGWDADHVLDYEKIVGNPVAAATAASAALDLDLAGAEIEENATRVLARNAKQAGDFSVDREAGINDAVEAANGRHFDVALGWAESALPGWRG